ncbi:MAG: hypothetical protein ACO200_04635 [Steroidobacteraceae bacterium]
MTQRALGTRVAAIIAFIAAAESPEPARAVVPWNTIVLLAYLLRRRHVDR